MRDFAAKTELPVERLVGWLQIGRGKFYQWRERYGKVNEHNALIPRDHWLLPEEKQAILDFQERNPLEGYRRLTFMMLDQNECACSPSSVYRVLAAAGRLDRWNKKPSKKGTGFVQPLAAHEHWHIDITYINVAGTFFYLCLILDGASRAIVHWELRGQMTERDVECILQRGREKYPDARPRIISDNGPQFIAKEFKEFIRQAGMSHVRTSPYYPCMFCPVSRTVVRAKVMDVADRFTLGLTKLVTELWSPRPPFQEPEQLPERESRITQGWAMEQGAFSALGKAR